MHNKLFILHRDKDTDGDSTAQQNYSLYRFSNDLGVTKEEEEKKTDDDFNRM